MSRRQRIRSWPFLALVKRELRLFIKLFLVFAGSSCLCWVILHGKLPWPLLNPLRESADLFAYYIFIVYLILYLPLRLLSDATHKPWQINPGLGHRFLAAFGAGILLALLDRYTPWLQVLNPVVQWLP